MKATPAGWICAGCLLKVSERSVEEDVVTPAYTATTATTAIDIGTLDHA